MLKDVFIAFSLGETHMLTYIMLPLRSYVHLNNAKLETLRYSRAVFEQLVSYALRYNRSLLFQASRDVFCGVVRIRHASSECC